MSRIWHELKWIGATILGSAMFAAGFALFLQPNDMNSGGISGLAMIVVELLDVGSVGTLSILINLPLFLLGGLVEAIDPALSIGAALTLCALGSFSLPTRH